jgi:hypothetical protein
LGFLRVRAAFDVRLGAWDDFAFCLFWLNYCGSCRAPTFGKPHKIREMTKSSSGDALAGESFLGNWLLELLSDLELGIWSFHPYGVARIR